MGRTPGACQPRVAGKDVDHNLLGGDWKNTYVYGLTSCHHAVDVDEGVDPNLHIRGGAVMVLRGQIIRRCSPRPPGGGGAVMVLLEGEPYEGVEPNLHGGGGGVIVLLEDEHLRFDEGIRLTVNLQKKERKCLHSPPLWVRDTLHWCLCPLLH